MYVRKFEADTLDEALGNIKKELGPDAIILKTITNKGIKGAFKKKKIEITAAISEKNYTKKAKVDNILDQDQKENFYKGSASYVANMIDRYEGDDRMPSNNSGPMENQNPRGGYGQLGLNRAVTKVGESNSKSKSGLDDFLSLGQEEIKAARPLERTSYQKEEVENYRQTQESKSTSKSIVDDLENRHLFEEQARKIDELEARLYELAKSIDKIERKEPIGLYHLRTTLKGLDISEQYIQLILKKALFELSQEDLENTELVFEFALREMVEIIHTEMPLFSNVKNDKEVVTVILSEDSCGQTSTVMKLATLKKDSVVVSFNPKGLKTIDSQYSFVKNVFDLDVYEAKTIPEIVAHCRKGIESGKSVFVDYKSVGNEINESKKFIEGLKRSFENVETLICLSAIHSELYNRRVVARYRPIADGITITHLDVCLNFGALFNLTRDAVDLPYKFYGTGETIPEDIESATAERILSGIFQWK